MTTTESSAAMLRQEWKLIAVAAALSAVLEAGAAYEFFRKYESGNPTPWTVLSTLVAWFAHAGWIALDRQRRGLPVGGWRIASVMFGPFTVALYLGMEYRAKALYLIPLLAAIYVAVYATGIVLGFVAWWAFS